MEQEGRGMIKLREMTADEYISELRKELQDTCLRTAVEKRCDTINEVCGSLGYVNHRYVQELLNEIMNLIQMYGGES